MRDVKSFAVELVQGKAVGLREMVGRRYRHYKGGEYWISDVVVNAATGELLVIYVSSDKGWRWCRPLESFIELVSENPPVKRFTEVI